MIRFSAVLVAVAIGVLVGGIATSKLLLVYVAIAASAAALVALAIGVVLKREELFGERRGQAPAGAVTGLVLAVRAGESNGQGQPNGQGTPPPPQGAAVGPGAVFAGHSLAAPPQPGAPRSAVPWDTVPRENGPRESGPWETQAARDAWPSGTPTAPVPAAWQAPSPPSADAAMPRAWAAPSPSVFTPRKPATSAAAPAAGQGSGPPNWFSPPDKPASAGTSATEAVPGSGSTGGWSWPSRDAPVPEGDIPEDDAPGSDAPLVGMSGVGASGVGASGAKELDGDGEPVGTTALAEDDDWPARYSWLDDEPDNDEQGNDGDQAGTGEPADADQSDGSGTRADVDAGTAEAPARGDGGGDEPAMLRQVRDGTAEGAQDGEPGTVAGSGTSAGDKAAEAATGTGLVTVIRGVRRYHQSDCVLIRFMPDSDCQKLSVAQAREAGCTPCAACQPDG